mgnify:CR=1 FL=1
MNKNIFWIFIMTIAICITFSLKVYSDFFTKTEVLKILDKINYYNQTTNFTLDELNSILPHEEIIEINEEYITKTQIKKDVNSIINSYYAKNDNKVKEEFAANLESKLKDYDLTNANLKDLISDLTDTYYKNIFSINQYNKIKQLLPFKTKVNKLFKISFIGTIFIFLINIIRKKYIYIFDSLLTTGLIFIIPKVFMFFNNFIKNFYYYNNSFSYFIKSYCYQLINYYLYFGLILIFIGVLGLFMCNIYIKNVDLKR